MTSREDADPALHLDDAQCADLVLGLLPEGARADALAHAATCRSCEARLRAHVGAAERAAFDRPRAGGAIVRPHASAWNRRRTQVVAAAATVIAASALMLLRPATHAPGPGAALPPPGETVRTRAGLAEDPHLTAGMDAWARHDLGTAERELSAARTSGSGEQMRRLYLADVRLALGDASGALALLRGLRWIEIPEPWRRDAAGLLVRALRRCGEGASADSIERALRTLAPGTPFVP